MMAPMRGIVIALALSISFAAAAARAQAPADPVQAGDRQSVADCVRQGPAVGAACIGLVAVPCVAAAAGGDRGQAEIACARREEAVWRERLTLASAALGRGLDARARSQFAALQIAWQSYAVQKCAFYGTVQAPARAAGRQAGCELREVAERALEIERSAVPQPRRPAAQPPQIFR